jgi:sortase (surface protein transpeptidase)
MTRQSARHGGPFRSRATLVVLLCGLLVSAVGACGLAVASRTGHPAPAAARAAFIPVPRGRRAPVPEPSARRRVAVPTNLIIPSIGVRTALIRLGLTPSGAMQVPAIASVAGWFAGSPRPGGIGSSVIVGHIDSASGPAVFYRLRLLHPGKRVYVRQATGRLAVFQVTSVHMYLKSRFPTGLVFGPTPDAQLRLITCGGTFDPATGHYLSNVVVYATFVR